MRTVVAPVPRTKPSTKGQDTVSTTVPNPPPPRPSPAAAAASAPTAPVTRGTLFAVVARLVLAGAVVPVLMQFIEAVSGYERQLLLQLPDDDRAAVDLYAEAFGLPAAWVSDYTLRGGTTRFYQSYHRDARDPAAEVPTWGAWHVMVSCHVHTGPEPAMPHAGRAQVPVAPRMVEVVA